ncbi:ATP/GTP-binding protein [Liquorilactobacillus sucicola DSM 21376 = JCM 15457]|uniref:Putative pyruvate, phosphate dikinase regulatory protein n=1 Tax=Liquorilactobacillus sucicola DSM 21376 = JCM 15457 TaxID=1423806 RepID=A0A023CVB3_9LACO|nr:pyruvate, water dikinase regulatory protein [Liquorilactobacillus sucicola]KRN05410.1 PEP synthetase regulatory protein [Liquorilactobacillus sucicola DSM 21376 = JCM 15457]GAJ25485.1 ATP/GTP-binding protein [Liquorilactobacillus sucicola DSM 21376 = JCM 15457]
MSNTKKISLFIISDSLGETGYNLAQAAAVQFPNIDFKLHRFPLTKTTSLLGGILTQAKRADAFIIYTFVDQKLSEYVSSFCTANSLCSLDALSSLLETIQQKTGAQPVRQAGLNHNLNETYFHRIKALEFAVTYDDGKDPSGYLKADIVLLGVSRTSKTPLSLYLANKNFLVANLPLVPKAKIPDEIWQVDRQKIIGLTNDPKILNNIRRERMLTYGLDPDTKYSNVNNIEAELEYANDLYKKLGCLVINVSNKSIEETATLITESLIK